MVTIDNPKVDMFVVTLVKLVVLFLTCAARLLSQEEGGEDKRTPGQ